MQHLLSAGDLDRATIDDLLEAARSFAHGGVPRLGGTVALVFFEDSLRTRVGFDVAATRLGMRTTTVLYAKHGGEMSAPESLEDTARTLGAWCEVLCLRHPSAEAPFAAAAVAGVPVVNCGNGNHEHPTQALVDLFAVSEMVGGIDGLRIALVGDLLHMRTAHSLLAALAHFDDVIVRCVSPRELRMSQSWLDAFGGDVEQTDILDLDDMDVVYMAGFPPHTPAGEFDADVRSRYAIDSAVATTLAPGTRILCPMPRIDEIATEVDVLSGARYFEQSAMAVWMRMAVLERAARAN